MKALVTGAAGFFGSFLSESLIEAGYEVVGVDNFFRGKPENVAHLDQSKFKLVEMDLSFSENVEKLHELLIDEQVEKVFHLAAINGTQYFYDRPTFVLDQNVRITQVLMEAIKNTSVDYVVYTSSSEVYGDPLEVPTKETHPTLLKAEADRDSYAVSKAIGDFYVRLYAKQYGIKYLNLRVFNMYGERMINTKYGQVIPEFIQRMLFEPKFTIIGDGSHTRSFCYIKDATRAIPMLVEKGVEGFLNLGNDEEISILTLAKTIHEMESKLFEPEFLPERPHDHKRRRPDISELLKHVPDFKQTTLAQGLQKTIQFYKGL